MWQRLVQGLLALCACIVLSTPATIPAFLWNCACVVGLVCVSHKLGVLCAEHDDEALEESAELNEAATLALASEARDAAQPHNLYKPTSKPNWRLQVGNNEAADAWADFADTIVREFVCDAFWSHISPKETFPGYAKELLAQAFGNACERAKRIDLQDLLLRILQALMKSLLIWKHVRANLIKRGGRETLRESHETEALAIAVRQELKRMHLLPTMIEQPTEMYRFFSDFSSRLVVELVGADVGPVVHCFCSEVLVGTVFKPIMLYTLPLNLNACLSVCLERALDGEAAAPVDPLLKTAATPADTTAAASPQGASPQQRSEGDVDGDEFSDAPFAVRQFDGSFCESPAVTPYTSMTPSNSKAPSITPLTSTYPSPLQTPRGSQSMTHGTSSFPELHLYRTSPPVAEADAKRQLPSCLPDGTSLSTLRARLVASAEPSCALPSVLASPARSTDACSASDDESDAALPRWRRRSGAALRTTTPPPFSALGAPLSHISSDKMQGANMLQETQRCRGSVGEGDGIETASTSFSAWQQPSAMHYSSSSSHLMTGSTHSLLRGRKTASCGALELCAALSPVGKQSASAPEKGEGQGSRAGTSSPSPDGARFREGGAERDLAERDAARGGDSENAVEGGSPRNMQGAPAMLVNPARTEAAAPAVDTRLRGVLAGRVQQFSEGAFAGGAMPSDIDCRVVTTVGGHASAPRGAHFLGRGKKGTVDVWTVRVEQLQVQAGEVPEVVKAWTVYRRLLDFQALIKALKGLSSTFANFKLRKREGHDKLSADISLLLQEIRSKDHVSLSLPVVLFFQSTIINYQQALLELRASKADTASAGAPPLPPTVPSSSRTTDLTVAAGPAVSRRGPLATLGSMRKINPFSKRKGAADTADGVAGPVALNAISCTDLHGAAPSTLDAAEAVEAVRSCDQPGEVFVQRPDGSLAMTSASSSASMPSLSRHQKRQSTGRMALPHSRKWTHHTGSSRKRGASGMARVSQNKASDAMLYAAMLKLAKQLYPLEKGWVKTATKVMGWIVASDVRKSLVSCVMHNLCSTSALTTWIKYLQNTLWPDGTWFLYVPPYSEMKQSTSVPRATPESFLQQSLYPANPDRDREMLHHLLTEKVPNKLKSLIDQQAGGLSSILPEVVTLADHAHAGKLLFEMMQSPELLQVTFFLMLKPVLAAMFPQEGLAVMLDAELLPLNRYVPHRCV